MKKKKIGLSYEFDIPELKASWVQLMKENKDNMALGLKSVLAEIGIDSDPKIYIKGDTIIVKKINTDKGSVLVVGKHGIGLETKKYKLVANNEKYVVVADTPNHGLAVWFRRTGGVDVNSNKVFPNVEHLVDGIEHIEDPLDVEKKIREMDIKAGVLNKDGTPNKDYNKPIESVIDQAIPKAEA